MKVKILPYTAGEAAQASGRSIDNQRNDRRAGYSPQIEGRSLLNMRGVCRDFIIQQFADRGIGPSISVDFADLAAAELEWFMVSRPEAWTQRAQDCWDGPPSRFGAGGVPEALIDQICKKPTNDSGFMSLGIVVWPTNEYEICKGFAKRYGELTPGDERAQGVVAMMGFALVSLKLAQLLPRPMFDIQDGVA